MYSFASVYKYNRNCFACLASEMCISCIFIRNCNPKKLRFVLFVLIVSIVLAFSVMQLTKKMHSVVIVIIVVDVELQNLLTIYRENCFVEIFSSNFLFIFHSDVNILFPTLKKHSY